MQEILSTKDDETKFKKDSFKVIRHVQEMKNKFCQISAPNEMIDMIGHVAATDTSDRPCCCVSQPSVSAVLVQTCSSKSQYVANALSKQITPLFLKQGNKSDWFRIPGFSTRPQESVLSTKPSPDTPNRTPGCFQYSGCSTPLSYSSHSCHHHQHHHHHRLQTSFSCLEDSYIEDPCFQDHGSLEIQSMRYGGARRDASRTSAGKRKRDAMVSQSSDLAKSIACGSYNRNCCPCDKNSRTSNADLVPTSGAMPTGTSTELKRSMGTKNSSYKKIRFSGVIDQPTKSNSNTRNPILKKKNVKTSPIKCKCEVPSPEERTHKQIGTKTSKPSSSDLKCACSGAIKQTGVKQKAPENPVTRSNCACSQKDGVVCECHLPANKTGQKEQEKKLKSDCVCTEAKSLEPQNAVVPKAPEGPTSINCACTKKEGVVCECHLPENKTGQKGQEKKLKSDCVCTEAKNLEPQNAAAPKAPEGPISTNCLCTKKEGVICECHLPETKTGQKDKEKKLQSECVCTEANKKVSQSPVPQTSPENPNTSTKCSCTKKGVICECHLPETKTSKGKQLGEKDKDKIICKCYDKPKTVSKSTSDPKVEPQQPCQIPYLQRMPVPQQIPYPQQMIPPELIGEASYEGIAPSCGWVDIGPIMKIRSEKTMSTSGFKVSKKKKLELSRDEQEIELEFEDAIKYYASMNPELFRDLIPEPVLSRTYTDKKGKKAKKDKKDKKDKKAKKAEKAEKAAKKKAEKQEKEKKKRNLKDKKDKISTEDTDEENKDKENDLVKNIDTDKQQSGSSVDDTDEGKKDIKQNKDKKVPKKNAESSADDTDDDKKDKKQNKDKKVRKNKKKGDSSTDETDEDTKHKKQDKDKKVRKNKKKGESSSENTDEENKADLKNKIWPYNPPACKCPYGSLPLPISYEKISEAEGPITKGFKFSFGGKGSASRGLTGLWD